MNWHWLLLDDFLDNLLFSDNDRFVMMVNIFDLCVRVLVMIRFYRHMNNDFLFVIRAVSIN